jgi:hypothetical protein
MLVLLQQTTPRAIMITGFVFMMMGIIEYLNVMTRGVWQEGLRGSRLRQYLLASFLGSTVPGHFLKEHLWNDAVKDHVLRVFLWTFGTLLLLSLLVDNLPLESWIQDNQLIVLLVACLIGLIPESGPHLLFLTLFVENAIPFSTFLTRSIVQDGHGTLPLLAESRGDFFKVKAINFLVGILVGSVGYASGW